MRTLSCLLNIMVAAFFLTACSYNTKSLKQSTAKLPFYLGADFTPQWIEKTDSLYQGIHTIPSFDFTDQDGKEITEKIFSGKIYVANFFFCSCPGICKRLTSNLSLVQKAFQDDSRILLLSHSVTPEADNVSRLKEYARSNGVISGKWHLVTGKRNEIYQIARASYFADEDLGEQKGTNDFLHTENILLIDTQKRIRGIYKGTSVKDINDLIADIKKLEAED